MSREGVNGVLKVLLQLLAQKEWEARHGGLLGLKYLLAVREVTSDVKFDVRTLVLLEIHAIWSVTPCCWVCSSAHFEGLWHTPSRLLDFGDEGTTLFQIFCDWSPTDTHCYMSEELNLQQLVVTGVTRYELGLM